MGLFDFFRSKSSKGFDIASIVQQMFDESGITPHREGNIFMTEVDGTNCTFQVFLQCDEKQSNRLSIYAPFILPVPAHVVSSVELEMERLNLQDMDATLSFRGTEQGCSIFACNNYAFQQAPTTAEIQKQMIQTVDAMDNNRFRSLTCAIMGYATYDEVEEVMKKNATADGSELTISMTDGYTPLREKCNLSSPRLAGRLLMFATHIIEEQKGEKFASFLLKQQRPMEEMIQMAYDLANKDEQRDVIRKLFYLMREMQMRTDHYNNHDSILGRLEAVVLIHTDIYSLLC